VKDGDDGNNLALETVNDSIRKLGWQGPADIAAVAETMS